MGPQGRGQERGLEAQVGGQEPQQEQGQRGGVSWGEEEQATYTPGGVGRQEEASGGEEQVNKQVAAEEGRNKVSREGGQEEDFAGEIAAKKVSGKESVTEKDVFREVFAKQGSSGSVVTEGVSGEKVVKEGKEQREGGARPVIEAHLWGDRHPEEAGRAPGKAVQALEQGHPCQAGRGAQEGKVQSCHRSRPGPVHAL